MVEPINTTVVAIPGLIEPIANLVRQTIGTISWLVGGIFGLYLILLMARWWQNRILIKVMKDIRFDLDHLNKRYRIKYSGEDKESKLYKSLKSIFEKK
ncbi:hypothetical protein ACFLZB_02555 [Nanoarchaeota archaeon]